MKTTLLLCSALSIVAAPLAAQRTGGFDFSTKNMMRGPELYGREPQQVRWSADGKWIYFNWLEPGSDWRLPARPFRVRATPGATPERLTNAQMDSLAPMVDNGRMSSDGRRKVVSSGGDLYLIDMGAGTSRQLTQTFDIESNPTFSTDGREIFFVRNDNVYSIAIDGGLIRQLTDIRIAGAAAPTPAPVAGGRGGGGRGGRGGGGTDSATARVDTSQRGVLERQQRELFDVIRDRARDDSVRRAEQNARNALRVRPMTLMAGERIASLVTSPNGRALLITTAIPDTRALATRVPNYVTESGYTEDIPGRTKVGDYQNGGRVAYMALPSGNVQFLRVNDDGRTPSSVQVLGWNDDGSRALVFTTSADFKTRWIHTATDSGAIKLVDTLRDSAWVAGPCFGCGGWYEGGKRFWFVSEADGNAHLYTMAADGSDRRQITKGKWEVNAVSLSRDGKSFYLTTSEESPFEQHFYRTPVTGGAREKPTASPCGHRLSPSTSRALRR